MSETRRRGTHLEDAILDAAWAELTEVGYTQLTMASVAARAGTSKPVLYRRWPSKFELVRAVIDQRVPRLGNPARTGDLRTDILAVLASMIAKCRGIQTFAGSHSELTAQLRRSAAHEATLRVTDVLAAVGLDPGAVGPHLLRLPAAMIYFDLCDGAAITDPAQIIDQLFLPLLQPHIQGPDAGGSSSGDTYKIDHETAG
jgi:AcrR family transcriptional regulator